MNSSQVKPLATMLLAGFVAAALMPTIASAAETLFHPAQVADSLLPQSTASDPIVLRQRLLRLDANALAKLMPAPAEASPGAPVAAPQAKDLSLELFPGDSLEIVLTGS